MTFTLKKGLGELEEKSKSLNNNRKWNMDRWKENENMRKKIMEVFHKEIILKLVEYSKNKHTLREAI